MQHPDTGQTIEVKDDMAPMYASQGWTEVKTSKSSGSGKGSK